MIITPYIKMVNINLIKYAGEISTATTTVIQAAGTAGDEMYIARARLFMVSSTAAFVNAYFAIETGRFGQVPAKNDGQNAVFELPHPVVVDGDKSLDIVTVGTGFVLYYEIWVKVFTPP